ncbi:MAG: HAD family hydrolase [Planctomycetota bacterium]|jgi:putative hydrolase of the HAD superfamily
MITTIVFDLDDTLYDEIDYCKSGFSAVAEFLTARPETPLPQPTFECLWNQFTSGNRTTTFNAALDRLGIDYDENLIRELVRVYRNHTPHITLPADTRDVLSQLTGSYTLALLTDGFLPAQQLKVRALGIEDYFKAIIYTEQLGREFWKPSPVGFEKLMDTLNAKPQNAVYVADNEQKDFIAPNKLGFRTVQLIRPARIHTESVDRPNAAAHHIIHKISRLPALLERF